MSTYLVAFLVGDFASVEGSYKVDESVLSSTCLTGKEWV